MLVIDKRGCEKLVLIEAIMETFEFHQQEDSLEKCVTLGVAASQITGQTIHSWAGLDINRPKGTDWVQKAGQKTASK